MDRFGPSIDCSKCGQTVGFNDLDEDGLCKDCSPDLANEESNARTDYNEEQRLRKILE